jgi:hypothetical protein
MSGWPNRLCARLASLAARIRDWVDLGHSERRILIRTGAIAIGVGAVRFAKGADAAVRHITACPSPRGRCCESMKKYLPWFRGLLSCLFVVAFSVTSFAAYGAPAPFDLSGPSLSVTVTRGGRSLPVGEVPNFASGDQLLVRTLLPSNQAIHYLLVAAFLRGPTNPPPEDWFFQCPTWKKKCAQTGMQLKIPAGAQQIVLFLAPETGGDFNTLRSAVRGRPGAFVRASQDLNQAALDRARLEVYLSSLRALDRADQARLREVAPLLARSLAIKVDEKCLDRVPGLQAPCLMQGQDTLILNDGHSTSIVEALTSGPASDLAMEASHTPQLNYGYYSPYLASIFDIGRLLDSMHLARYQYIPALATYDGDRMNLALNTPPSFHAPQSVLVAALPAVEPVRPPPLHAVDPRDVFCASKDSLVLPVEGAPLAFAARYAHDLVLRLSDSDGKSVDLPARADAEQGGIVVETSAASGQLGSARIQASLHGYWGFDVYDGPQFLLVRPQSRPWELSTADGGPLVVGRDGVVTLRAGSASCVRNVGVKDSAGREIPANLRTRQSDQIDIRLSLQDASPGELDFVVTQYGVNEPQQLSLQGFPDAGRLGSFTIHEGDEQGVLAGGRLDLVTGLKLKGTAFVPGPLIRSGLGEELPMPVRPGQARPDLKEGEPLVAHVTLKDGRVLPLNVVVSAPRPVANLIARSIQVRPSGTTMPIRIDDPGAMPSGSKLTFSIRSSPSNLLAHDATIEVASSGEEPIARLTAGNGALLLASDSVAIATLDAAGVPDASAFGALKFRLIARGAAGDWQPLVTLVRMPDLERLRCPAADGADCDLVGTHLFLLDAVSTSQEFGSAVEVPAGYPGSVFRVPRVADGRLYVRLRDMPAVIGVVDLPVAN